MAPTRRQSGNASLRLALDSGSEGKVGRKTSQMLLGLVNQRAPATSHLEILYSEALCRADILQQEVSECKRQNRQLQQLGDEDWRKAKKIQNELTEENLRTKSVLARLEGETSTIETRLQRSEASEKAVEEAHNATKEALQNSEETGEQLAKRLNEEHLAAANLANRSWKGMQESLETQGLLQGELSEAEAAGEAQRLRLLHLESEVFIHRSVADDATAMLREHLVTNGPKFKFKGDEPTGADAVAELSASKLLSERLKQRLRSCEVQSAERNAELERRLQATELARAAAVDKEKEGRTALQSELSALQRKFQEATAPTGSRAQLRVLQRRAESAEQRTATTEEALVVANKRLTALEASVQKGEHTPNEASGHLKMLSESNARLRELETSRTELKARARAAERETKQMESEVCYLRALARRSELERLRPERARFEELLQRHGESPAGTSERDRQADNFLVDEYCRSGQPTILLRAWSVFVLGNPGSGKSHVLQWLQQQGIIPMGAAMISGGSSSSSAHLGPSSGLPEQMAALRCAAMRQPFVCEGSLSSHVVSWTARFLEELRRASLGRYFDLDSGAAEEAPTWALAEEHLSSAPMKIAVLLVDCPEDLRQQRLQQQQQQQQQRGGGGEGKAGLDRDQLLQVLEELQDCVQVSILVRNIGERAAPVFEGGQSSLEQLSMFTRAKTVSPSWFRELLEAHPHQPRVFATGEAGGVLTADASSVVDPISISPGTRQAMRRSKSGSSAGLRTKKKPLTSSDLQRAFDSQDAASKGSQAAGGGLPITRMRSRPSHVEAASGFFSQMGLLDEVVPSAVSTSDAAAAARALPHQQPSSSSSRWPAREDDQADATAAIVVSSARAKSGSARPVVS